MQTIEGRYLFISAIGTIGLGLAAIIASTSVIAHMLAEFRAYKASKKQVQPPLNLFFGDEKQW